MSVSLALSKPVPGSVFQTDFLPSAVPLHARSRGLKSHPRPSDCHPVSSRKDDTGQQTTDSGSSLSAGRSEAEDKGGARNQVRQPQPLLAGLGRSAVPSPLRPTQEPCSTNIFVTPFVTLLGCHGYCYIMHQTFPDTSSRT